MTRPRVGETEPSVMYQGPCNGRGFGSGFGDGQGSNSGWYYLDKGGFGDGRGE